MKGPGLSARHTGNIAPPTAQPASQNQSDGVAPWPWWSWQRSIGPFRPRMQRVPFLFFAPQG